MGRDLRELTATQETGLGTRTSCNSSAALVAADVVALVFLAHVVVPVGRGRPRGTEHPRNIRETLHYLDTWSIQSFSSFSQREADPRCVS